MDLQDVPEALALNRDYAVSLIQVNYLDDAECGFGDNGCTGDADAQFYFADDAGERQLKAACFTCLIPAVRHHVSQGEKITVEVPK